MKIVKYMSEFFVTSCKQNSDVEEIHKKEMQEAYKKATEEYMALHPEAKDIELKYDPKKLLESLEKDKKKPVANAQIVQNPNQLRNYIYFYRVQTKILKYFD
jgi:hypothetical protein